MVWCVCVCVCVCVYTQKLENTCGSQFSPSTNCVLGNELRPLGSASLLTESSPYLLLLCFLESPMHSRNFTSIINKKKISQASPTVYTKLCKVCYVNPRGVLKSSSLTASAILCDAFTSTLSTRLHTQSMAIVVCSLKTKRKLKRAGGFKPGIKKHFV